jgi:transposase
MCALQRHRRTRYADRDRRVWAVEGCNGIGHHIAMQLLAAGEQVIDVPPRLSARARVFATGQGRKTDATDAHSVALVGTRMAGLRPVADDEQLGVLGVLVDRRGSSGPARRQPGTPSFCVLTQRGVMSGHARPY